MKPPIEIIFEDDDLVIVNKPSGVLSIPDRYVADKPNLVKYLNQLFENVFVVHRLDRETSGIICFAKNAEAHKSMSLQFESRTVDKIYYALVEGQVYKQNDTIEKPIGPSLSQAGKMVITSKGKKSVTLYEVLERFKHYTLVAANIKTGRTHQIRVHFESIGHPLAVDEIYGRKSAFFLSSVKLRKYKTGKNKEERPLMSRTTLHATELSIDHPTTKERMTIKAALPKDFSAVLNQLRKWGKRKTNDE